jgi:hypothetical protein
MRRIHTTFPLLSGILLLVALSAALLTPTDCSCGAELPHPHVLFELPGHTHTHSHDPSAGSSHSDELPSGPTLSLPTVPLGIASTLPILSASSLLLAFLAMERRYHLSDLRIPDGVTLVPLDPPPRW